MKKLFFYCATLLTLASCSQDDELLQNGQQPSGKGFKFELITASDNSRAVTNNDFKTSFSDGDQVGLYVVSHSPSEDAALKESGNYADNYKLTYTAGEWIADKDVAFPTGDTNLDFYAYYPYVENVNPTSIEYNASASMYDLMMAKTADIDNTSETVTLTFYHQLGLLDANVVAGAGNEVSVEGLCGAAKFNLGSYGQDNIMTLINDKSSFSMSKVESKHFRAYVPAQEAKDAKLVIKQGSNSYDYALSNSQVFKGFAYKYNITSSLVNLADLPNCYIVKPGESVTFPVYKAYGVWREIAYINGGNLRNDGALGAKLIWQDKQSLIESVEINLNESQNDQSTVTVKTSQGNGGNALVSVTMGGEAVWSWHIWVTDFDPDKNTLGVDNNGDGIDDYIFMDRNLGAMTSDVNNPLSIGMYYQGSNNEPYAGFTDRFPSDGDALTDIPLYDIDNNNVKYTVEGIWGYNQGQSTRRILTNPGLFVTSKKEPYSWLTDDASAQLEYGANYWTVEATGEKGVFDPSPEGWMIPAYKNGLSPWASYLNGNTPVNDPLSIYPKGGRMRFDGTFGNCISAMLYSGTMDGLKNMAFECNSDGWGQLNKYSCGNALNVRCVKIK